MPKCMTTFNVFTHFWNKNLFVKRKHSSVELTKTNSSWSSMLECVGLAAKFLCQKYANTLKVVIMDAIFKPSATTQATRALAELYYSSSPIDVHIILCIAASAQDIILDSG
jgi:hypothetical protein